MAFVAGIQLGLLSGHLIFFVSYERSQKPGVFVLCRLFQPRLFFVGKGRSLPWSGAHEAYLFVPGSRFNDRVDDNGFLGVGVGQKIRVGRRFLVTMT
jgi:hypothetical protein